MNKLFPLTKIYLKQTFGRFLYGEKARRRGLTTTIVLLIAIVAVVEWAVYTMVRQFADSMSGIGLANFVLTYGFLISAIFSIFTMVYELPSLFYKSKDYEMLASLPIKSFVVVSAKFISGFVTTFFYSLIFTLPTIVVYFMYVPVTAMGVIFAIFSLVFSSMFVMFVSSVLGFIVNLITSKMKHKTVFTTIFMFLFLALVMGLSMASGMGSIANMFGDGEAPLWLKIVFPYIYFIQMAIDGANAVYFIYFILINLAYLLLAIAVVSGTYKKINSNLLTTRTRVSKKPLTFKKSSVGKALFKKETRSFFGSTVWSLNTIVGPIMVIIIAVVFGAISDSSVSSPELTSEEVLVLQNIFKGMFLVISAMFSGMVVTTCVSISMEGKNIQILKQLPVSFKQVATSKILFSVIIEYPAVAVANIIYLCFVPFDIFYTLLLFIVPLVSILAFSVLGLVINLRFPKLEWRSETEAVKQSMSLFVSMFSDLFIGAIPLIIYFAFGETFASLLVWVFSLVVLGWFVLWLVVSLILLKKLGKKYYDNLC